MYDIISWDKYVTNTMGYTDLSYTTTYSINDSLEFAKKNWVELTQSEIDMISSFSEKYTINKWCSNDFPRSSISINKDGNDISVVKLIDEWYYVSVGSHRYYKCDQWYGISQFIHNLFEDKI